MGLKKIGLFSQNVALFTGLSFLAAAANAFFLSDAATIVVTRAEFAGAIVKALGVGVVVSAVLTGRNAHHNRRMQREGSILG